MNHAEAWARKKRELGQRIDEIRKDLRLAEAELTEHIRKEPKPTRINDTSKTWILAMGQKSVPGFDSLPDLRGQFLRGLNFRLNDSTTDPDVDRMPGCKQVDAFQGHRHGPGNIANSTEAFGSGSYQANYLRIQKTALDIQNSIVGVPVTDGVNGTPRTAMETRPKNVAIYWYIKVK